MNLINYVRDHITRGECQCSFCIDKGNKPDPTGHTADMVFFKAVATGACGPAEFVRLTQEHKGEYNDVDPLDKKEHNYIELGGWIGDQGLALEYMALGYYTWSVRTTDTNNNASKWSAYKRTGYADGWWRYGGCD